VDLRDAIQNVRDTVKAEQAAGKAKPSWLLSYLLYLRQKLTNSRTELMMQDKNSPKDCVRLLEIILHNLAEMKTIQLLDVDEDFQQEVEDQISVFKGVRCRYLADAMKAGKRWEESLALYEKTKEHFQRAQKGLAKDSPCQNLIKTTLAYIDSASLESHAQATLARVDPEELEKQEAKLTRPEKPLVDRLDDFVLDESLISGEPNVAKFPPDYKPVPCKPLFFDLALNHVQYPKEEVQDKAGVAPKKSSPTGASGLTGFVKGLWGWGGK
jgi:signal recognition particle subunit SRP68